MPRSTSGSCAPQHVTELRPAVRWPHYTQRYVVSAFEGGIVIGARIRSSRARPLTGSAERRGDEPHVAVVEYGRTGLRRVWTRAPQRIRFLSNLCDFFVLMPAAWSVNTSATFLRMRIQRATARDGHVADCPHKQTLERARRRQPETGTAHFGSAAARGSNLADRLTGRRQSGTRRRHVPHGAQRLATRPPGFRRRRTSATARSISGQNMSARRR